MRRRSLLVPRALRPARSSGFWRSRAGATAVEFALIAAPLFFMLFCVIDLACVMLAQATLDQAVFEGARLVRTGQMQTGSSNTASAFQADVCAQMVWAQSNCLQNLYLDVRTYTSFASASPPNPISNKTFNTNVSDLFAGAAGRRRCGARLLPMEAVHAVSGPGAGFSRQRDHGDHVHGRLQERALLMTMRRLSRLPGAREGVAAVEFALLTPFLISGLPRHGVSGGGLLRPAPRRPHRQHHR